MSRIAVRLEKIQPEIEAIAGDLEEFGLNFITVDLGSVKVAISSSNVTFHDKTTPSVESNTFP